MLAQHWTDVFQQVANQICGAYLIGPTLAQKQYIYVPTKSVVYNMNVNISHMFFHSLSSCKEFANN
jgi:hypothetical protein